MLLKKWKTAFYATTYTVVQFESIYRKLFRVFLSALNAHLSIVRIRTSALEKIMFVGLSADSTLLKHAYTTLPYCNTLDTSAFTNYTFTLTFEIPNILQLVLTAWNVLYAIFILAYNIHRLQRPAAIILQNQPMLSKFLNNCYSFVIYF